ncbi:conserved hypothetical protein [Tenacibaculum maritimum]|uniref:excisionase family DNA-binding protein n=1 Tax=Tenacibaculum maritimum TaxID=107401 RepID=UPI0012E61D05|nr:excisionase family DNA-binding protein [Tenacibaculum maritimum]CAA0162962.1 conserved hypothetical protein [Tenacibaculum maritimum]CAA0173584.1 DNA-binding protein [Tenacibaculum maritimum]
MENILNTLNEIKELLINIQLEQKEFLTVEELSFYLNISTSTIYKMTSGKKIAYYSPGGKKNWFKKSDIHKWLIESRNPSNQELEKEIESYLGNNLKSIDL